MEEVTTSSTSDSCVSVPFKIDTFLHADSHQHASRSPSLSHSATPPISKSPSCRDLLNRIDGCPSPRVVEQLRSEGLRPRALSNPPPVKTPLHQIIESEDEEGEPGTRASTHADGLSPSQQDTRRRAGSFLSPLQRGHSLQLGERA